MLSEEEKKEMLEDAKSLERRASFAQAKEDSLKSMTWPDYFLFLKNIQKLFPTMHKKQSIPQRNVFKL